MKPIFAALAGLCCLAAGACGAPALPLGAPSARDILSRPAQANLKDAHFSVLGRPGTGAAAARIEGAGDVVFKPRLAVHMLQTTLTGSAPVTVEILSVDGAMYQRIGNAQWAQVPAGIQPDVFSAWSGGSDPQYAGEETVKGSRCWHVTASRGSSRLDLWVRESDGYPIRSRVGQLVVDYGHFNSGLRIAAPPPGEIRPQPRNLTVGVGEVAHLNGVDVSVASAQLQYQPAARALRPKPGSRLVVAEIVYTLTGHDRMTYGLFEWSLTDAEGATYEGSFPDRGPRLGSGDLTDPGSGARGFIMYQVPAASSGLKLRGAIGTDSVTVTLG